LLSGKWTVELDTAETRWGGPSDAPESTTLAAWSAKLLAQAEEIDDPGRER
jgi:hypothetical protein